MSAISSASQRATASCSVLQLRPVRSISYKHNKLFTCFKSAAPRSHRTATNAAASKVEAKRSATAAIERGLEAFSQGNSKDALTLFQEGLSLNPNKDEARAALYNSACCLAKDKQWQGAADAITKACNEYGLKYSVVLKVQKPQVDQPCPAQSSKQHGTFLITSGIEQ